MKDLGIVKLNIFPARYQISFKRLISASVFLLFLLVTFTLQTQKALAYVENSNYPGDSSVYAFDLYESTSVPLAGPSEYGRQCVEYVDRFYYYAMGYNSDNGTVTNAWNWTGNGEDYWSSYATKKLDRYDNGGATAPQANDLLAFGGGSYGHVGIILSVGISSVTVIQQNAPSGQASIWNYPMSISNGYYSISASPLGGSYYVQGWLRKPGYSPQQGTLSIRTTPINGPISVTGTNYSYTGTAPADLSVNPGSYTVTFGNYTGSAKVKTSKNSTVKNLKPRILFKENPTSSEIKDKLYNAAVARGIPPEILYGIAYQESGWRQYDDNGDPVISYDGGIGIMQVTSYGSYDVEKLKWDIDYNIGAGADILLGKWAVTPMIGDNSLNTYENWFYAVWAYNGWVAYNSYPYTVWNHIANGYGRWMGIAVTPVSSDWLIGGFGVQTSTPTPSHTWTPDASTGSLTVDTTPVKGEVTVKDGANIVDQGIAPRTITNLSAKSYLVSYSSLSGWETPASQTVTVVAGQTTSVTGTYKYINRETNDLSVMKEPSTLLGSNASKFTPVLTGWNPGLISANGTVSKTFTLSDPGMVAIRYSHVITGDVGLWLKVDGQELVVKNTKDDGAAIGTREAVNYVFLPAGTHTISFTAGSQSGLYVLAVSAGLKEYSVHGDFSAPSTSISAPAYSTTYSLTNSFAISWSGTDSFTDAASSGISGYQVQHRRNDTAGYSNWKTWVTTKSAIFTGKPGYTYYFKVRTKDNAGNISSWSYGKTIVPYDDSVLKYSGNWKDLDSAYAYGYKNTLKSTTTKDAYATLAFTGKSVTLIARMGPYRGIVDVYTRDKVNGVWSSYTKVKTIDLYSSTGKNRAPLFIKSWTNASTHQIKFVATGTKNSKSKGTSINIDGVAVLK